MTTTKYEYIRIPASQVPEGVRFDVPARNQGQHTEVAYGGFGRAAHCEGDKYKRVRSPTETITGQGGQYYMLTQVRS